MDDMDDGEDAESAPKRMSAEKCIEADEERRIQIADLNIDTGANASQDAADSQYFSGK